MGRSTGTITRSLRGSGVRGVGRGGGIIIPVPNAPQAAPKENVGIMSGSMRKPTGGQPDLRGSRRDIQSSGSVQVTMKDPDTGQMYGGLVKEGVPQFKAPDGSTPQLQVNNQKPTSIGARSSSFYSTLDGSPEREVPIPEERMQRISRRPDPRGRAPFSPDERGMARNRFFEKMFERSDERRQQRSMEREERDNVRDSLRSERGLRGSEDAGPGDERAGEGRRRRRSGGMRRRRGRRRDFTRRRSRMEGGRRGRSGREMAAFRDQYVSTLR